MAKHPIPDDVFDSYALPVVEDDRILHDIAKAMRLASETHVRRAADTLIADFRKPMLMAWAAEDPVFPLAHAQAYASRLSNARLETIADAYSFTAEDQPERLAELIAAFVAETAPRRERDGAPTPGVPPPWQRCEVGGVTLAFRQSGQGRDILCLHAIGHGGGDFDGVVAALAPAFSRDGAGLARTRLV